MPEFFNPSDTLPTHDECLELSTNINNNEATETPSDHTINVIDADIGTVSYRKCRDGTNRSLSVNNYDYEQHLKVNSVPYEELKSEFSNETESIDKHNTKNPFLFCKKTKIFLCICGFLQLCALFMIGYIVDGTTKNGKYIADNILGKKYK